MEYKRFIACTVVSILFSAPVWVGAAQQGQPMSGESTQSGTSMQSQQQTSGQNQLLSMQVKDIKGKSVVNATGEEIGDVNKIVQNQMDDSVQAVVSVGGFLGIGTKKVTIPIDQLSLQGDKLMLGSLSTKEQIKQLPEYDKSQSADIQDGQKLADAIGASSGSGMERQASFQELDTNSDGYLSQQEAESDQQLADNWKKADQNNDNQIDRSEFSAFEMSTETEPSMQEQEED
jgi:sporulation protein YlmC with PRC-barrel domain